MSKQEREIAGKLLGGIKKFADIPVTSSKVFRCHKGYWIAELKLGPAYGGGPMTIKMAYNYDGHYVGDPKFARNLDKRGISPELMSSNSNVCSIGKSDKDGKWYGWSHRAIYGFKVGHVLKRGDIGCEPDAETRASEEKAYPDMVFEKGLPEGFQAKTEDDCRTLAKTYARAIG